MNTYRIQEIRRAKLNGRAVLIFKAFKLNGNAFIFCGQFSAPVRTPKAKLVNFISEIQQ